MSADKHRGIRRQKQKRAKDTKKQGRRQRPNPAAPAGTGSQPSADRQAA